VVRFADEGDLFDRLSRELRDGGRRLQFLIGPDLVETDAPWPTALVRVADEYAQVRRNDDLRRELRRAAQATEASARFAGYRAAFDDWLGAEEFDAVIQQTALGAYRPAGDDVLTDPSPARLLNFESAQILEMDPSSWRIDQGLLALGRLAGAFGDRIDHRILTTALDPAIVVALRQVGVAATPLTPFSHPLLSDPVTPPGSVNVLHLLGYWRPLSREHKLAPLPDLRAPHLPPAVADLLHSSLAGATVCVLGYRGGDPIIMEALQAAVADGAQVLWAVRDPHAYRDPKIRVLADRIGGGESVIVHGGVDGDLLLRRLALHFGLIPETNGSPGAADPPAPELGTYAQPELARSLGVVPLRAPADGAPDLLRQLGERFGWRLERAASPAPALLFWPVRLRPPSVIHMVQALAAAALSAHGVRVVLALDDFGEFPASARAFFEERVNDWFSRIPDAQPPDVMPLQAWIENQERLPGRVRQRPTRPWAVLQEYYGQRKPSAYETLRAAKIVPDIDREEAPEHATQIVDALITRGSQRLLTAPAVWSLFNHLLLDRRVSEVITLAGDDERRLWRHRQFVTGEPTRHLYHPRIANLSQDSGLIRWEHHSDLGAYIERAVGQENWRRTDRYIPWLVRHAFLLPEYLHSGGGASLDGQSFDAWQDVLSALQTTPELADLLARRISSWFLGEQD
jgi:hypothetical protein